MTIQLSETVRNACADALETAIGTSPVLKIRTGSPPTSIADGDSGDVLATLSLPPDWLTSASSGSKSISGTWQDLAADDDGTAAHFRIYASNGTTQHMQGTVSMPGGGGDMIVDNTSFATGQTFSVEAFTITAGNAPP